MSTAKKLAKNRKTSRAPSGGIVELGHVLHAEEPGLRRLGMHLGIRGAGKMDRQVLNGFVMARLLDGKCKR